VRKSLEEVRILQKTSEHLLEELAELQAAQLLAETPESKGQKLVVRVYSDRDLAFIKLLAQKLTRLEANVVALLGAGSGQASLVFAQSKGLPFDMGALLKETVAQLGGRGGGTRDMAQGGGLRAEGLDAALASAAAKVHS
jgi:alanyl-tRNA synthetase